MIPPLLLLALVSDNPPATLSLRTDTTWIKPARWTALQTSGGTFTPTSEILIKAPQISATGAYREWTLRIHEFTRWTGGTIAAIFLVAFYDTDGDGARMADDSASQEICPQKTVPGTNPSVGPTGNVAASGRRMGQSSQMAEIRKASEEAGSAR